MYQANDQPATNLNEIFANYQPYTGQYPYKLTTTPTLANTTDSEDSLSYSNDSLNYSNYSSYYNDSINYNSPIANVPYSYSPYYHANTQNYNYYSTMAALSPSTYDNPTYANTMTDKLSPCYASSGSTSPIDASPIILKPIIHHQFSKNESKVNIWKKN